MSDININGNEHYISGRYAKKVEICIEQYGFFAGIILFSIILFRFAYMLEDYYHVFFSVSSFLSWHVTLEFSSILVSFSIFIISFFSFKSTKNVRSMLLGVTFLIIGMIDFFHTMSYKGMPIFLIPNDQANRATTFWIAARLAGSTGFLVCTLVPAEKTGRIGRGWYTGAAAAFSLGFLMIATCYPQWLPPMYIEGKGLTPLKIIMEYMVMVLNGILLGRYFIKYMKNKDRSLYLLIGAFILSIFSEMCFTVYNSVYDIYNFLGHIYKFIAFLLIFQASFINEIEKPYEDLDAARKQVKNYAENLEKTVEERTQELQRINDRLLHDLEYARGIQKGMLPVKFPKDLHVEFAARYWPCERVGGDFYNVIRLNDRYYTVYIGDVAGHGVPAAMLTVFVNQTLAVAREDGEEKDLHIPSRVMKKLYQSFNKTNFPDEMYVVLLYGIYDTETGEFTYSSAGINCSPVVIRHDGRIETIEISGFPICKFGGLFDIPYEDHTIMLEKSDKLFLYTDGLVDVANHQGEAFGVARMERILAENSMSHAEVLSRQLEKSIWEFTKEYPAKDDITFLVLKASGAGG